ncbi:S8 family peptidase [Amycolatopsis saalfeldensis]|uniref:Subtilase family protein n=1 Tax=Amycolatopsis saalfeldensis TaxID=394193 RepID=A0A1H8X1D2_9PSEU|nr:S8 family serine peptidase [Amycolatopsis saalfeldensis]SEP33158.1 Subtilase family protein [Amycolatopsis saalfeldensis]
MTETPEQPNGQTLPLAAELKPLPDELIVDSDDLVVVLDALRELKTEWAEVVEDTRLGLARLTGVACSTGEVADLPGRLRAVFATSAGGWQPEVDLHWSTLGSIGSAGSKPMGAGGIEPAGSKPMGTVGIAGSKPMSGGVIGPIAIGTEGSKPMTAGDPMDAGPADQPAADAVTGAGVAVAMIDTPLFRHPVFTGRDVSTREWHTKGTTTLLTNRAGHGTFVCSVILAHAPAARIEADGALDGATSEATEWEVAQEIVRLGDRADILNLSLASHTLDGAPSLVLRRAVDRLPRRVLVIAAAGNHGETEDPLLTGTTPMWPAALPGVVAVGAMDRDGIRLPFSPDAPWVSCQAVGFEVRGAYPGGWAKWTGTSFAAARVTGMVAAWTVPGRVSPAEAFELVLDDPGSGVERYHWTGPNPGQ